MLTVTWCVLRVFEGPESFPTFAVDLFDIFSSFTVGSSATIRSYIGEVVLLNIERRLIVERDSFLGNVTTNIVIKYIGKVIKPTSGRRI